MRCFMNVPRELCSFSIFGTHLLSHLSLISTLWIRDKCPHWYDKDRKFISVQRQGLDSFTQVMLHLSIKETGIVYGFRERKLKVGERERERERWRLNFGSLPFCPEMWIPLSKRYLLQFPRSESLMCLPVFSIVVLSCLLPLRSFPSYMAWVEQIPLITQLTSYPYLWSWTKEH